MERRERGSHSTLTPGLSPVRVFSGGLAAGSSDAMPTLERADNTPIEGPGQTIGRYALYTEIASGGMASVHIGRLLGPAGFARTVAIKRLHPPLAKDPEFVAMFLDEARLAARIRHPNVVSTLDVVATEGELFVVMEYVPGESLARLLRAVRTNKELVPVPIAAAIMVGVLHGLHAAHEAHDERGEPLRIVHRDVSPHNILVGTDGDAHVIDFGIAKARGRAQITRQGQIKGKLSYMPSEQLLGHGLDHRADIFAASIVLWEALTGQRLFEGVDDGEVYAKVLRGVVDPPSLYAKGLSKAIDAIVLRGLARDRADRYSTAREMALALEAAVSLAPPSHVGQWVERLVGDALAERTERIADIERLDDAGDSGEVSSAILSRRSWAPPPQNAANEQGEGASGAPPSRPPLAMDRTAPTQPTSAFGIGGTDPRATVVDRPFFAVQDSDSDEEIAVYTRRRSHGLLLAATVAVVAIVLFGARDLRGRGYSMISRSPAIPSTAAAAPQPPPVQTQPAVETPPPSSAWVPVPPTSTQATPEPKIESRLVPPALIVPHKRTAPAPVATHSVQSRTPATTAEAAETPSAAPAPRATAASSANCDPPFWIDADGTKRYNRQCGDR